MKRQGMTVFPAVCADLGGAQWVAAGPRVVLIKLPGMMDPVRMKRSELPEPASWTAFTLADAAAKRLPEILWGTHPAHGPEPLKLSEFSRAEFARRQASGWSLEVCAAGERPVWLGSTVETSANAEARA